MTAGRCQLMPILKRQNHLPHKHHHFSFSSLSCTAGSCEEKVTMAKNDVGRIAKKQLATPSTGAEEIFQHSKRSPSNPKAKNWLEESWKSLEHFNNSHLGRLRGTKNDEPERTNELDMISESSSIEVDCKKFSVQKNRLQESREFEIPSLPCGMNLAINIHTTWGDKYYVGLNGIELYSDKGELVSVAKIEANPPDLTVLPDCKNDPRVVDNLLNGINHTCDDVNMWLAPFTSGGSHVICITFAEPTRLAMIRFWNYNKSRIHSERGAKAISITLDDVPIFCGEINKASGSVAPGSNFGDNILFTTDDAILEKISKHDTTFEADESTSECEEKSVRPSTGNNDAAQEADDYASSPPEINAVVSTEDISGTFCAKCLRINILSTWGDPQFVGLTGLQVLGELYEPIPFSEHSVRDCIPKAAGRDINRLIDDTNITTSHEHMWKAPFSTATNSSYSIEINFVQACQISGIRVWNYNKSFEDTYCGAKEIEVKIDDRPLSAHLNNFILRRAPGNLHYDFAQDVVFETKTSPVQPTSLARKKSSSTDTSLNLHYDIPYMPTGFVYKIELFDTWGDLYYIGLNGIELFDASGKKILLTEKEIAAFPSSVNILDQTTDDIRTPDKLIDGVNDTREGQHMWLAPILPGQINCVYIVFDSPHTVSMVKLWNYAKTSSRGAKNFAVLVDDLLVYNGILQPVSSAESSSVEVQSVVFSEDKDLLINNLSSIACEVNEQDVRWNDHDRVIESRPRVDQELRPTTSLVSMKSRVKAKF